MIGAVFFKSPTFGKCSNASKIAQKVNLNPKANKLCRKSQCFLSLQSSWMNADFCVVITTQSIYMEEKPVGLKKPQVLFRCKKSSGMTLPIQRTKHDKDLQNTELS